MRLPDAATPLRIGLGVAVLVAVVLAVVFWNPLTGYLTSRLAKAEAKTETTQDALQGQRETVQGQQDVETAAQEVRVIVETVREVTHAVEIEARRAPDADAPLDPDRLDRLRAHDVELCALRPALCSGGADGRGPEADAAGGDPSAL